MKKMNKESIIRKLKDNKKLLLIFSIIFISGLIVGIPISMIVLPKSESKFYIATDDIWFSKYGGLPDYYHDNMRPDMMTLCAGGGDSGTGNPNYDVIYIRFDVKNKPKTWTKCEISLYVYEFKNPLYSKAIKMDIFEGNWNESSGNTEVYWKIEKIGGIKKEIGFDRTDITEYIENMETDTFSIRIYASGDGFFQSLVWLYSSEWDGTDQLFPYILPKIDSYLNYLPQLIWS